MNRLRKQLPVFGIITPTLNNETSLEPFLKTITRQNYPKDKVKVFIIDGGSKDKTLQIAKKHKLTIIHNPYTLAEPGIAIGMEKAQCDLKIVLAADNIFSDKNAFQKIAEVFEDSTVYAAFPKQNYDATDNILTKYHNTFTDPFNHFVQGDSSNARTFYRVYKTTIHTKLYDIYDFHASKTVPMISFSQGFTIRGSYRRKKRDIFDDNRPVIELIKQNKKIAYIHALSIYHHTINNLAHFIKKQRWATQNALEKKNYGIAHRYSTLSEYQKRRIAVWPIYSISIIFPLIMAIRGVMRDRELLWLFHPVNCLLCAYANFVQLLVFLTGKMGYKIKTVSRQ